MDILKDLYLMEQTYSTLFCLTNKLQVKGGQYIEVLTSRQLMAMTAIIHLPEEKTTLNNIARKLGTTKQSVKQLISIIEKKGYVITVPSLQDKRAVNVKITESGKHAIMSSAERAYKFLGNVFEQFTTKEMETLWNLLKKLYRFDGEEQDGFEEEINYVQREEKYAELENKILEDLKTQRSHVQNKGGNIHNGK